jgi:hypothetical protein
MGSHTLVSVPAIIPSQSLLLLYGTRAVNQLCLIKLESRHAQVKKAHMPTPITEVR